MKNVSIIIPAYQTAPYIKQAIDSVLAQTYPNYEIIVVDDGSTDSTPVILASYQDAIKVIRQENRGPSAARNNGIQNSSGEWIAFLDADDVWLPDKLARQADLLEKDESAGLVYSDTYFFGEQGTWAKTSFDFHPPHNGSVFNHLFMEAFIPMLTVLARRSCLLESGLFDPRFQPAEDYDLWLRLALRTQVAYIKEPLAKYRIHPNQVSSQESKMLASLIRIKENLLRDAAIRVRLSSAEIDHGYYRLLARRGKMLIQQGKREEAGETLSRYRSSRGLTWRYCLLEMLRAIPRPFAQKIIAAWERNQPFHAFVETRDAGKAK